MRLSAGRISANFRRTRPAYFGASAVDFPLTLSGLKTWHHARDVVLNGSDISAVIDQSAAGNNLIQATEAAQPAFDANGIAAGVPSISTDGIAHQMEAAFTSAIAGGVVTVAVAYKATLWAADGFMFSEDDANNIRIYKSGTDIFMSSAAALELDPDSTFEGTHVGLWVFNGASSKAYVDGGAAVGSGNVGSLGAMSGLNIGARHDAAANFLACNYSDIVVVSGTLTDAESDGLGDFLANLIATTWTGVA